MTRVNIVMAGNPGKGKSTILNGLTQQPLFKAGVSKTGLGITEVLQVKEFEGRFYIDTPGLDSPVNREKCAQEIRKALQKTGLYFICFVITLEAGRTYSADVTTIKLILDAAEQVKSNYSIIVNKLEKPLLEYYRNNREEAIAIVTNGLPYTTKSVYFMPLKEELFGKDNIVPSFDAEFAQFLLNAPCIEIAPERVHEIKTAEYDSTNAHFEQLIAQLKEQQRCDKDAFNAMIKLIQEQNDRQFQESMTQQREMARWHEAEIAALRQTMQSLANRGERSICKLF